MSKQEKYGGLDFETARLFGLGRAEAVAVKIRADAGQALPGDPVLTDDDFRCDAEQVEISKDGKVRKSSKPDKKN